MIHSLPLLATLLLAASSFAALFASSRCAVRSLEALILQGAVQVGAVVVIADCLISLVLR